MSKSDENTNELESYGVWVKNNSQQPEDITDTNTQAGSDDMLDIPEFDDSDFSDMFKNDNNFEEPKAEEAASDTFVGDEDSTLTADELMNIANTTQVEDEVDESMMFANGEEISNDNGTDEVVLHDFPEDAAFENAEPESDTENDTLDVGEIEEPVFDETSIEENFDQAPAPEESIFEEPSAESKDNSSADVDISEFGSVANEENSPSSESDEIEIHTEDGNSDLEFEEISFDSINEPAEENTESTETKVQLEPGEEEISLDDFLEDGFSDDSVASGNNGYEPGKEPGAASSAASSAPSDSGSSEEISLDDFIDTSDFGVEVQETSAPAEETIEDEPVLDMELSFDDSADTIETEDNKIEDDFSDFTADDSEEFESDSSEETTSTSDAEEPYVADSSNISTEEVDLSDFGIDSDAEETPVTQNVEEKKASDAVVDYDLAIGDEDTLSSAPVINEIKAEEQSDETAEIESPAPQQTVAQPDPTTTSLLQQIMAELSGLKNDINTLKSEIDEVKEREANASKEDAGSPVFEEPAVIENETPVIEETSVTESEVTSFEEPVTAESEVPSFEEPVAAESQAQSFEEPVAAENETPSFEEPVAAESQAPSFEEPVAAENETPSFEEPSVNETQVSEAVPEQQAPHSEEAEITLEDTSVFEGLDLADEPETVFEENQVEEPYSEETAANDTSSDEIISEEPVIEESSGNEGGFFSDGDDDTISLSEDELTQIPIDSESIIDAESETIEEVPAPVEESNELSQEEENITSDNSGFFTDDGDETIALSGDELANIMTTTEVTEEVPEENSLEEPVFEESPAETPAEETFDAEPQLDVIENEPVETEESEVSEDLSFDFDDKNLEEPDINNIQLDEENEAETDLPDEISIPKDEDIFVESNQTDFMDSVNTSAEEHAVESSESESVKEAADEPVFETTETIFSDAESDADTENTVQFDSPDTLFEEHFDTTETLLSDLENVDAAETKNESFVEEAAFDTIDNIIEEPAAPVAEESSVTEAEVSSQDEDIPTVDKILSQPVTEEETAEISSDFAEVDNLDTNISKDNIDYLNSDKENAIQEDSLYTADKTTNDDLKRDIKSVLLYMDQLLENLPEEKIMEFAKSDEFVTYKKLFSELGLS